MKTLEEQVANVLDLVKTFDGKDKEKQRAIDVNFYLVYFLSYSKNSIKLLFFYQTSSHFKDHWCSCTVIYDNYYSHGDSRRTTVRHYLLIICELYSVRNFISSQEDLNLTIINDNLKNKKIVCLCNRKTLRFDFLHSVMVWLFFSLQALYTYIERLEENKLERDDPVFLELSKVWYC